jgi:Recombinase
VIVSHRRRWSMAGGAVVVPAEVADEIRRLHEAGYGRHKIAATLNRREVPTASGRGRWWSETVRAVLDDNAYRRQYQRQYRAGWGR